jgi:hypothetical protein
MAGWEHLLEQKCSFTVLQALNSQPSVIIQEAPGFLDDFRRKRSARKVAMASGD